MALSEENYSNHANFWIFHCSKRQSGNWRWASNDKNKRSSRGYFSWALNEPSGNGNCAKMWGKQHLWYDDTKCDRKRYGIRYICERASGGWTWYAKHDGAIHRFELSCNEPSYCADLEEQKKIQLQELEITKMEVSPILVV